MNVWWLLLLGLLTYFILQRNVAHMTRTPIWALWLVMMAPAFSLSVWMWAYGTEASIPIFIAIPFLVSCIFLYGWLVQRGRMSPTDPSASSNDTRTAEVPQPEEPVVKEPAKSRPIDRVEEKQLRECFPWSIYPLRHLEYRPQAVICRGQLRASPDLVYQTIRDNVEKQFGDRFLVVFQESLDPKQPLFILVPNPQAAAKPDAEGVPEKLTRPILALSLLLMTLFTTMLVGAQLNRVTIADLWGNWAAILQGLPYALSLVAIFGIHELGHYLAARTHDIRATLPYFIPFPGFLGTFGAFTQMRSPIPNRKALFDVSLAGPISGFLVTLPILVWGLVHSQVVPLSEKSSLLNIEELTPQFSLLLTLLSKWALGSQLTAEMALDLHPVAIAGYLGLILTAFNLTPIGRLDGGHIIHAMFGQRTALGIAWIVRLVALLLSVLHKELIYWAILLFFFPVQNKPALNDVSELDDRRDFLGILALAILAVILLPAPRVLMG
jgi:membrane-associated protease RseP (regulator of RpoE activity)